MIQAVIFDCFGVLTTDGWLPFRDEYFGSEPEKFEKANELMHRLDAGIYRHADFIKDIAHLAGVSMALVNERIEANVANTRLFNYIRDGLKPKYKIGLLSNAGANWLAELFTPEQVELFDSVQLSFEAGLLKPDPRAYLTITSKLGVQPAEAIFVDDQWRHCDGATAAGLSAVLYKDFEQAKAELGVLLPKK